MSKAFIPRSGFERSAEIFVSSVVVISLLAIAGWLFKMPVLAAFSLEYFPMAPLTAIIFVGLCGAWFFRRFFPTRNRLRVIVQIYLLEILIIVLILAIRYFTGYGIDIEQLVVPNPPLFGQISSARMSPLTALGFILIIPAYLLLTGLEPSKRRITITAVLSLLVYTLSSINCLGYFYGAPLFYGGTFIPVALPTALSFMFFSLGLLMSIGPSYWPINEIIGSSLKARLKRAFIPSSILIVLFQGFLSSNNGVFSINPAVRVAVAVVVSMIFVIVIISFIAKNLGMEIDRGNRARLKAESTLKDSEVRFHKLFEHAAIGVALIETKTGRYLDINQRYCEFLGYTKEEMLKMSFKDVTDPDYVQENIKNNSLLLAGKISEFSIEKRYIHKNGRKVWGLLTASPLWKDSEVSDDFIHIAVVQDITARKHYEMVQNAIFRISQAAMTGDGIDPFYRSIHSILGELLPAENIFIALYDSATGLIEFPYYIDQYDEPPKEPTRVEGLTGYVIRTERPLLATREIFDRLVQQGEVEAVGTTSVDWLGVPLKVGERIIGVIAVQSYIPGIHYNQEDMDILGFVSSQVAQAIERKRLEEEILSLTLTDELTGLYNRRGFTLLADQEIKLAHRMKRSLLLFFGDVDNLKAINDTLGHVQGDLALKQVAASLKECFREADILARIGGDEFVVLAVDASVESAEILTNRIHAALEAQNQQGNGNYQLSLSIGVAPYDLANPCTLSELIAQADSLMYEQKRAKVGKNYR